MSHVPTTASDQPTENAIPRLAARSDAEPADDRKRARRDHKISFLDNLIRNIDIMIYCELSILYYMEYGHHGYH